MSDTEKEVPNGSSTGNHILQSQRFPASERLRKDKEIQELFEKGSSFFLYPYKVMYRIHAKPSVKMPAVLISVSKKYFKKAVDRKWMIRRIREAYRLNKNTFFSKPHKFASIAFISVAKQKESYAFLEKKMIELLQKLVK
ncbi:MAG: ribonuclease P protein component [Flammeovirgaceae bacterium]